MVDLLAFSEITTKNAYDKMVIANIELNPGITIMSKASCLQNKLLICMQKIRLSSYVIAISP